MDTMNTFERVVDGFIKLIWIPVIMLVGMLVINTEIAASNTSAWLSFTETSFRLMPAAAAVAILFSAFVWLSRRKKKRQQRQGMFPPQSFNMPEE